MKSIQAAVAYAKRWFECITYGGHHYDDKIEFDRSVQAVYQRCLNCGRRKYHWGELWA